MKYRVLTLDGQVLGHRASKKEAIALALQQARQLRESIEVKKRTVTGHTSWPQNGPFDANLAHLISCNTAFLCKNTTHKTPQSAEPFAFWLR